MGVDAEFLIRVKCPKPTKDQIALWSWDLVAAIGADHFWIDREKGRFALKFSTEYGDDGEDVKATEGKIYQQDGDDILAEEGEWFLRVSTCDRFYGVGYERGDILTHCAIAEWCEQNLPNCSVWYGGDSSGCCAELFDDEKRKELKRHLFGPHGRDYRKGFCEGDTYRVPEPCKLCVKGRGMIRNGWGATYIGVFCDGCGKRFRSDDSGKTWKIEDKEA